MKHLHLLPLHSMLSISEHWLTSDNFCTRLDDAGALGVGMHAELVRAHDPLAELHRARTHAKASIRRLIDEATRLDGRHDSIARALNHHLHGLIEAAETQEEAAEYRDLEALLYPAGLSVTRLPYIQEGGAAVALERVVSAELRAKLAAIPVGTHTLESLFDAWIAAGVELRDVVLRRATLKASLGREGTAIDEVDLKSARARWLNAVRGLLWAIDTNEALEPLREQVYAELGAALEYRPSGGEIEAEADEGEDEGEEDEADAPEVIEGEDEDDNEDALAS